MNNRGRPNLGDEIINIVQDAVSNRNFNRLNSDIRNAVNYALDEVRKATGRNTKKHNTWNNQTWKVNEYPYNYNNNSQSKNLKKYTVPVGQLAGTLFTIFGSVGIIGSVIASMVLAIIGYSLGLGIMYNIISFALLPLFVTSIVLFLNGSRIRKRIKRFKRYISQMQGRSYYMIKDFSSSAGQNIKYIAKDLQKMIVIGMFPEGHIDDEKTCFMLNNESYEQYIILQENMRMREREEQERERNKKQAQEDKVNKPDSLEPEIRKAINEGRQYVQKIRYANIALPGEEISGKLDRLEEVTGKIFDYVEKHPEKFPEIKKFTEYFLPTTLKLVDAYREFEYQTVKGDNISNAKKEIEETMDTINHAFENLLDDLFEDAAMDISTDISVLETMFAQEGLAKKNKKI
jgi:5-bromo-4-chloroindolyl phosphate hydrolysis protein